MPHLRAHDNSGTHGNAGANDHAGAGRSSNGQGMPGAFSEVSSRNGAGGLAGESFVVALAHELRGPLAAIDSAAAVLALLLADGAASGSHMTAIIQRQVRQLGRLVDDLLDIGRITHGKLRCEFTRVSLSDTIATAIEMHRSAIDTRQLRLNLDVGGCWVKGDPQRLVQIFSNLLDNATKFSPVGGQIHLAARRTGANRLAISIRDEGVGIDPSQIAKVFDPYQQGHPRNANAARGLGLGLAIVRGLVEQHGGTICVRSDGPGHGSEFIFTLHTCDPPPIQNA